MTLFTEPDIALLVRADEALDEAKVTPHFVEDCGRIQGDYFTAMAAMNSDLRDEAEAQAHELLREAAVVTA